MDTVGEEESGTNGESIINIYTLPCVTQIVSEKLLYNMEPSLVLCDDLERWFGERERGSGRRGHLYNYGRFALLYSRKPIQHCKAISPNCIIMADSC